jgi:hypothetical protein
VISLLFFACTSSKDSSTESIPTGDSEDSSIDTGLEPPWDWCPDSSAGVGSGEGTVTATPATLYCSASNESRTLQEELPYKARLRVVEGSYPVPITEGLAELALLVCIERASDHPEMSGAGNTTVSPSSFGGDTYTYLEGSQPMQDWTLDHTLVLVGPEGETPAPLILNGQENDAETGSGAALILHETGASAFDKAAMPFSPCMDPTWVNNVHTVGFDGGNIKLELFLGNDPIITAPGNFQKASGTLDGIPFELTDFFQLVYRPGHHHMDRHFAVIFDAPIGETCALLIEEIDAQQGTMTAKVSTADCSLNALSERTVSTEDWTLE